MTREVSDPRPRPRGRVSLQLVAGAGLHVGRTPPGRALLLLAFYLATTPAEHHLSLTLAWLKLGM